MYLYIILVWKIINDYVYSGTNKDRIPYPSEYKGPFRFEIKKTGYETYISVMDINQKINQVFTLRKQKQLRESVDGDIYIAVDPANGSYSSIVKI